jgi:RNA polymerase sigma-70 factor (ECF subfamily)
VKSCAPTDELSSSIHDSYAALDDRELICLVSNGNHHAFTELVRRHTSICVGVARRTMGNQADADDVVQQVFIKLWQRPAAWDAQRSSLSTWLYQVVLNACRDHYRSNKKHQKVDLLDSHEPESPDTLYQLDQNQQGRQQQALLAGAMRELSRAQADAINLAVFNGLPQKKVAEILGVSVKAVESLLGRAKVKLKKVVEKNKPELYADE